RKVNNGQWQKNNPKVNKRLDRNNDGNVGRRELQRAKQVRQNNNNGPKRRDLDNNPPGRRGGPGASPDRN
ncbi:MAG: hypothetical protein ACI9Y8_002062, partial [Candidatus Omnitrophota bacterium]